jgi:hypothetical protein
MRPAICAALLLLAASGCSGKKDKNTQPGCPPPASTASAGSAQISAQAEGRGFNKVVVIHAKEKANGAPVHGGKVSIRAEMSCPHFMPMYTTVLKETGNGTYKGGYNLVMQGRWTFYITLRGKNGDATTTALPVTVKASG